MKIHKIILCGPSGSGKTSAINAISDNSLSVPISAKNKFTTHFKTAQPPDFGVIQPDHDKQIHLFGLPADNRFDYLWDLLTEDAIGLIILINNSDPDPFKDLIFFLELFKDLIQKTQLVIGVTHSDIKKLPSISDYHHKLGILIKKTAVFNVDARNYKDIAYLIDALLFSLEPRLEC